jgi:hypothetical protein
MRWLVVTLKLSGGGGGLEACMPNRLAPELQFVVLHT